MTWLINFITAFLTGFGTTLNGTTAVDGVVKSVSDGVENLMIADSATGAITVIGGLLIGTLGLFIVIKVVRWIVRKVRGRM